MKKKIVAMIAIACLMVVSISAFASSHMQAAESMKILNEKDALGADNKQASGSSVTDKSVKVDDSCRIQSEQPPDKDESTVWSGEANQNQISNPPIPLPDGRIFLQASAGTEDPIPYIPTENPKTGSTTPIVPPELDN